MTASVFNSLAPISWNLTYLIPSLGQLDSQAATGSRLSDTTFSSHKDPLKALLVDDVLQRRLREIGIVNVYSICHVGNASIALIG